MARCAGPLSTLPLLDSFYSFIAFAVIQCSGPLRRLCLNSFTDYAHQRDTSFVQILHLTLWTNTLLACSKIFIHFIIHYTFCFLWYTYVYFIWHILFFYSSDLHDQNISYVQQTILQGLRATHTRATCNVSIPRMMQRCRFSRTIWYTRIGSRTYTTHRNGSSIVHIQRYTVQHTGNNVLQHMRAFADRSEREL